MQNHLGLDQKAPFYTLDLLKSWNIIKPGSQLLKSISLFPRIDSEKIGGVAPDKETDTEAETLNFKPEISIEVLSRIDLRVGTVLRAEKLARAKKLLTLEVDIGEKRTVVAGIAGSYTPESLVGKQVIVVANLKPVKLMGILSNGMVLAAEDNDHLALVCLDKPVKPGTPLR